MKNSFAVSAAAALVIATAFLAVTDPLQDRETTAEGLETFSSEREFREYISSSPQNTGLTNFAAERQLNAPQDTVAGAGGQQKVQRHSSTNIQVKGVSEADILKNTGEKIYYSGEDQHTYYGETNNRNTSVFRPLPAENFSKTAKIPESGRMFLGEKSLIFLGNNITSYTRPGYGQEWSLELNSSTITSARKINSSIYLVLQKDVSRSSPCPVRPMESVTIPCTEYYRPSAGEGSSTTYNLVKLNAENGEIQQSTGFVGSGWNTVVYMSRDSLYLTYLDRKSETEVLMNFMESRGDSFFDQGTMERIDELQTYELSDQALQVELQKTLRKYLKKLPEKKRDNVSEKFEQAWANYTSERKRQLSTTGIAEFNLDLELEAEGQVPGEVNDQFSLSERNGNLRIATTVGNSWRFNAESANDLYILNENLETEGQVQGMGLTEQIYSVRYLNDKAYIVTFRRVDPFHVVDLSNPQEPEVTGKLKLPGFSSYLHPLSEDRILGIGEEDGKVKAVIFDVSGDEPTIRESKVLDDWYSSISDSHHAFKIDRKHEVFFLPGSEGGHIFSYSEGLQQVKEVNMTGVKRATYVNDNLYVFSENKAAVINEENWKTVKEIQFRQEQELDIRPPVIRDPVLR